MGLLSQHVPLDARVLDVGAGTGLAGQRLAARGYTRIAALDASAGMLAQARAKGIYGAYYVENLREPLSLASDSYDAVLAVGVFADKVVGAEALPELIRLTRSGGVILFSVLESFYQSGPFRADLDALEQAGAWRLLDVGAPFSSRKSLGDNPAGVALIYEVC